MTDVVARDLTEVELRYLRLLHNVQERAFSQGHIFKDELEDFILLLRDTGATVRGIAGVLEVGPSTVQTWTDNARQRRDTR